MNSFAPTSFSQYNAKTQTLQDWARTHARRYFHEVDRTTPFALVYTSLITYAGDQLKEAKSTNTTFTVTDKSSGWSTTKSSSGTTHVTPTPVQSTSGSVDHATLNRVCYREHTNWWDAFKAEAEDAVGEYEGTPLEEARYRWVDHTARVLQRSTGYSYDSLQSDVDAWFDRHALN
jgi:hypothetical protein